VSFGGLITTASEFRVALGEVVRADNQISVDPVDLSPRPSAPLARMTPG
jgi:hypothetical protein